VSSAKREDVHTYTVISKKVRESFSENFRGAEGSADFRGAAPCRPLVPSLGLGGVFREDFSPYLASSVGVFCKFQGAAQQISGGRPPASLY